MKWAFMFAVLVLSGCERLDPGVLEAERAVKRLLTDSDSVQFSDVARIPETGAYCGVVSSKNRSGEHQSFRYFVFKDSVVVLSETLDYYEHLSIRANDLARMLRANPSGSEALEWYKELQQLEVDLAQANNTRALIDDWCSPG